MSSLTPNFYNSDDSGSLQAYHDDKKTIDSGSGRSSGSNKRRKSSKRNSRGLESSEPDEQYSIVLRRLRSTWDKMNLEYTEMGLDNHDKVKKQTALFNGLYDFMSENLELAKSEKAKFRSGCIALQRNIFKMLRVFSKNGYKSSPRRSSSNEETLDVSDETYTEINQIVTNEDEFNDIMKAIPDKYTKNYLLQKVSPPYTETHSYLLQVSKLLSKEYFSRLLKFLRTVLLLKESAEEIDFFSEEREENENMSRVFSKSLPTIEQCKICIHELEKVSFNESNIDTIYKVVSNILEANNFNNLSKTYLNKIQYQIELVEIEKGRKFDLAIEIANKIVDLWKVLYEYVDTESENIDNNHDFDEKIIRCSEGDVSAVGLTLSSMNYLESTYSKLTKEKESRAAQVQEYLEECTILFARLKEVPERVDLFFEKFNADDNTLSETRLQELKNETYKLREKKKLYMKDIINFLKLDIEKLWQKLFYADEQKYKFKCYWSTEYNDEVLGQLEEELANLQELSNQFGPMFEKVSQFNVLQADKEALEEAAKNPSRLLARNSGTVLLKEEKMRKNIKRRFPKVCTELETHLVEFDKATKDILKNEDYYILLNSLKEEAELMNSKPARPKERHNNVSRKTSPIKATEISPRKAQSVVRKPPKNVNSSLPKSFSVSRAQSRKNDYYSNTSYFNMEDESPTSRPSRARRNNDTKFFPKLNFSEKSKLKLPLGTLSEASSPGTRQSPRRYSPSRISPVRQSPNRFSPSKLSPRYGRPNGFSQNKPSPIRLSPLRNINASPSTKYNVPLNSINIKSKKSELRKLQQQVQQLEKIIRENPRDEVDNIFLIDEDKENNIPKPVLEPERRYESEKAKIYFDKASDLKLIESEKLAPIDYRDIETVGQEIENDHYHNHHHITGVNKQNKKKKTSILGDSAIFNDSMGDDLMYKNWKEEKLRKLRSFNNILPDKS